MKSVTVRDSAQVRRAKPKSMEIEIPDGNLHHLQDDQGYSQLSFETRQELKSLGDHEKERIVGNHIAAAIMFLDSEPDLAVKEATEAVKMVSRLASIRELLGVAAYKQGDYRLAIREMNAARRINGHQYLVPLIVDSYRGLGKPERAFDDAYIEPGRHLTGSSYVEMTMVLAGAYADLGRFESAYSTLSHIKRSEVSPEDRLRLKEAKATFLEMEGRTEEANLIWEDARKDHLRMDDSVIHETEPQIVYDLLEKEA